MLLSAIRKAVALAASDSNIKSAFEVGDKHYNAAVVTSDSRIFRRMQADSRMIIIVSRYVRKLYQKQKYTIHSNTYAVQREA
jgi:hypothetical protein